jgi:hypothetical protein
VTQLSEEDVELLRDLGLLDEEPNLEEVLLVQPPPEEPEPPNIDSPPGEWTEYSDTPPAYRLLRFSRGLYQPEDAEMEMRKVCMRDGLKPHGEGYWDARFYCWRLVSAV